jgi:hypothetical protein
LASAQVPGVPGIIPNLVTFRVVKADNNNMVFKLNEQQPLTFIRVLFNCGQDICTEYGQGKVVPALN